MESITEAFLNEGQKMIYGRRRIIDAFYKKDEKFHAIQATDIASVTLQDDLVNCQVEDTNLFISRKEVIENFWAHRTRTPSFFDYKIWSQALAKGPWKGTPIAALDYGPSSVSSALEPLLGRVPRISTDRDGVQRIYYVMHEERMCSCDSWSQMHTCRTELEAEFEQFTSIKFVPICKHLQWYDSSLALKALSFYAKEQASSSFHPCICAYHFDHRTGHLLYRITTDGLKANAQWLPVNGWKQKPVYDTNGLPNGACWETFTNALSQEVPYHLVQYSQTVAGVMNAMRSKN
jgi:hypothetical protein